MMGSYPYKLYVSLLVDKQDRILDWIMRDSFRTDPNLWTNRGHFAWGDLGDTCICSEGIQVTCKEDFKVAKETLYTWMDNFEYAPNFKVSRHRPDFRYLTYPCKLYLNVLFEEYNLSYWDFANDLSNSPKVLQWDITTNRKEYAEDWYTVKDGCYKDGEIRVSKTCGCLEINAESEEDLKLLLDNGARKWFSTFIYSERVSHIDTFGNSKKFMELCVEGILERIVIAK